MEVDFLNMLLQNRRDFIIYQQPNNQEIDITQNGFKNKVFTFFLVAN